MIFALDTYLVLLSVVIGYQFLRILITFMTPERCLLTAVSMLISHHVCAFIFHQYKQVWTYTGIGESLALMKGITLSATVTAAVQYGVFHTILFRLLAVSWMVQLLFIGGSRMISRVLKETIGRKQNDSSRALIIGAGSGTPLVRQLTQKNDLGIMPVAFIDDDQTKHKLEIMGLPVIGGKESIMPAVQRLRIHHIIIAIPSLCTHELQTLYKECVQTGAHIKIMPQFDEILLGTQVAGHIRDVKAEDLLGRKPVTLDTSKISDSIKGKRFWSRAPAAQSVLKSAARSARFFRGKSSFSATGRTAFIPYIPSCPHASAKRCSFTRRSPIFRTEIKSLP